MAQGRTGGGRSDDVDDAIARAQRNALFVALGTLLSTMSLVLGLLALNASVTGAAPSTALPWLVTLMTCAVAMGLVCVVQQRLWNLAWRRWAASHPTDGVERASWVLHLVSYLVVVVGIFAGVAASQAVGFIGAVSTFATLALVPLVAAQVLGAVQHVRRDGPPGTVPTHVRRLAARIERSRHAD